MMTTQMLLSADYRKRNWKLAGVGVKKKGGSKEN